MTPIVSAAWLKEHLGEADLQVIDATWHLASSNRDALREVEAEHIPGAIHLDIDKVAATRTEPPYRMLPSPQNFGRMIAALGIRPAGRLVVYDNMGLYSAARVRWMFQVMGHGAVSVLDGGLPAWKAIGGTLESGPVTAPSLADAFPVAPLPEPTRDWRQVLANITSKKEQIVDVRPASMFNGDTSNLYAGVRPGHIPGSINLSQRDLRNANHTFKTPQEIRAILEAGGIDLDKPVIASCGSGVTACILTLAFDIVGKKDYALYDGSWEEWGIRRDLPAELDGKVVDG